MADGSSLHIYGSVYLESRLRIVSFEADLLVCRITNNAILRMEFLSQQDCSIACKKGLLLMEGKTIQCRDRLGRLLAHVTRTLALPPDKEVHVSCRPDLSGPTGLIDSLINEGPNIVVVSHPRHT